MEKYKRYYGVALLAFAAFVLIYGSYNMIAPKIEELNAITAQVEEKQATLEAKQREKAVVAEKIKKLANANSSTAQKKIYAPIESDLGNDTLFFTLYNDVIEMVKTKNIKIKNIDYKYNPENDEFVASGKDIYFVCDINMDLVSNYTQLGKLIEDIYRYPYYIKINEVDVTPYNKDKKILLSHLSLRLYAYTEPDDTADTSTASTLPGIE